MRRNTRDRELNIMIQYYYYINKKFPLRLIHNKNYSICETYPEYFLLPRDFSDEQLGESRNFRTKNRIPGRNFNKGSLLLDSSKNQSYFMEIFSDQIRSYITKM